jgi:outer membrane cobalamin receptor
LQLQRTAQLAFVTVAFCAAWPTSTRAADGGTAPDALPPDGSADAGASVDADLPEAAKVAHEPVPTAALPAEARAVPPTYQTIVRAAPPPRTASQTTVERPVLEAAPHRTGDDLLNVVPGVFLTQHSGEGKAYQIFYRGFDAVHGQDLEIWAGGAPVNDVSNIHGQGYADLHFLPVEVVSRIVATPGTYDPRQGDFAVAGSMRFELGFDRPGATLKATTGQFGARRLFLGYRPPDRDERTFAAVELYETDGFGPSRAAQRASAMGQAVFSLGDGTTGRLLASTYAGHFSAAGVLRLSDIESGAVDRFATYDAKQGGNASRTQLVAEIGHLGEHTSWHLATYLVQHAMRLRQNFTGFLTDVNGDSSQQLNDDFTLGAHGSYDVRLPLWPRDTLEVGFFARDDRIEQSQKRLALVDDSVTADQVDARVHAQDVAGYIDLSLHPFWRLTLRGGLRADGLAYESQDLGAKAAGQARASEGFHLGKKATVDVLAATGLRVLASYGEGFRSPQARSLAEGETTPFTSVRSGELGVRLARTNLAASLAAFHTRLSDDLVFDQGTGRNERVPATRRTGAAGEVTITPLPWLVGAASGTYTRAVFAGSDATYAAGALVPYAPQWVFRADAAATPELGVWYGWQARGRLGVGTSWLARRPLPFAEWGHDVFLIDASAGARLGRVELGIDVFNLLDARWYDGEFVYASRWNPSEAAALVPQRHVTVGAPRTAYATLTVLL